MPSLLRRSLLLALLTLFLVPSLAQAADAVRPTFDLTTPTGAPFPSDVFTDRDPSQLTGLRVDLPKPNCAVRPSDCADVDVLNDLDGFNLQPRISIPFTDEIDPTSVSSANVFLVRLPDGAVTGINQIIWEPETDTLHVESDQLLDQHTRYLLVVTNGIRSDEGDPIISGMRRVQPFGPSRPWAACQRTLDHPGGLVGEAAPLIAGEVDEPLVRTLAEIDLKRWHRSPSCGGDSLPTHSLNRPPIRCR